MFSAALMGGGGFSALKGCCSRMEGQFSPRQGAAQEESPARDTRGFPMVLRVCKLHVLPRNEKMAEVR